MIEVAGLSVDRDGRRVLDGVSLTVGKGAWVAVVGPNGAGKSTLLQAVAGLLPYSGRVALAGRTAFRGRERARTIAYAPQNPVLPEDLTVFDYTLLGRAPHLGYFARESARDRAVAEAALARLDLTGFAGRRLGRMSGGERQRVVLARALAQQAPVLLLDEPTTALDLGHQQQVLELLDELRTEEGLTVVTTLHDLGAAGQYADELALVSGGRIAASGPPGAVLTADLVAAHFGARVRVTDGPDGRPLLALERP
ncbi:iron complex transport system ATP-binding protein [Actinocorallia herbida]|uniref:Iron complex transport system ATP-binding protein n=1 Tax=Actinocorallia herbida TaxID=58109 RepID=A0A3N1D5J6_9ACTN|nr:ABC transporter ATP-binding protein [Actinocorallia herbida]ROO88823.1 iron complex transport system ATP-binding protein [Actinocorallia herbida]